MDFEQAKLDIEQWIRDFVEKPNPALNNWAPCPYARQARLANTIVIVPGNDPYFDLVNHWRWGMQGREVVVLVYDPAVVSADHLENCALMVQVNYLDNKNMLALTDHPDSPEIINGVAMNQGQYALIFVQDKTKLAAAAQQLVHKGYYQDWPEDYLQGLFAHRQGPRQ
jgi:hypothetical protein